MNKISIFALIIALVALFSACGQPKNEPASSSQASSVASPSSESQAPSSSQAQEEQLVTGSIVYADGASLAVVSLEDQFLSFSVVGDDIDKSEVKGISNGAEVDIFYTGTINGRDTSQVKVTKLAQTKQQAAVRTDVHLTGGTILESDGTILKVATYDGAELSFDVSDTEIDREGADGLVIGEKVAVFFEGEIVDNSTENVRVVKLVQ